MKDKFGKTTHIKIGDEVTINNCEDEIFEVVDIEHRCSLDGKSSFECALKYRNSKITLSNYTDSSRLTIV